MLKLFRYMKKLEGLRAAMQNLDHLQLAEANDGCRIWSLCSSLSIARTGEEVFRAFARKQEDIVRGLAEQAHRWPIYGDMERTTVPLSSKSREVAASYAAAHAWQQGGSYHCLVIPKIASVDWWPRICGRRPHFTVEETWRIFANMGTIRNFECNLRGGWQMAVARWTPHMEVILAFPEQWISDLMDYKFALNAFDDQRWR